MIRGKLIGISSARNKANRQKILALSAELDHLYKKVDSLHLDSTRQTIDQKLLELDSLLSAKVEKSLRWSRARFLLHSNIASTMFARKLNQSTRPPHVYKLATGPGQTSLHPQEVLRHFKQFYSSLLAARQSEPPLHNNAWFQALPIPSLSSSQQKKLNSPITLTEVLNVIKSLKSGSAPGPDGFLSA